MSVYLLFKCCFFSSVPCEFSISDSNDIITFYIYIYIMLYIHINMYILLYILTCVHMKHGRCIFIIIMYICTCWWFLCSYYIVRIYLRSFQKLSQTFNRYTRLIKEDYHHFMHACVLYNIVVTLP